MINLTIFIPLLWIAFLNYIILKKWNKIALGLKGSVLFLLNSLIIIIIVQWFISLSAPNGVSNTSLDKLIVLNSFAIKIRNSIILMSLFYLSYGTYSEYINSKKKIVLITFFFIIALSILYLIAVLIAGSFMI